MRNMTSSTRRLAAAAVTETVIADTGCGSNDANDKRSRLLWAFADARSLTIGPSLLREATLAPKTDITTFGSVPIHGTIVGRAVSGSATGRNDLLAVDIQAPWHR